MKKLLLLLLFYPFLLGSGPYITANGEPQVEGPITVYGLIQQIMNGVMSSTVGETVSDATYYVRTTGLDTNDCLTTGTACLTIQHVIDLIPTVVGHEILVDIGEGTFDGFALTGRFLKFEGKITVRGTLGQPTLGGGTATGTATAGVKNTLEDSGQAWVVNALRGYLVLVDGEYRVVRNNTGTSMELVGNYAANTSGKAYEILEQKSVLGTEAFSTNCVVLVHACAGDIAPEGGAFSSVGILIEDIQVSSSVFHGVRIQSNTPKTLIRRCRVTGSIYYGFALRSCVYAGLEDCFASGQNYCGMLFSESLRVYATRIFVHGVSGVYPGIWGLKNNHVQLLYVYADSNGGVGVSVGLNLGVDFNCIYADGNGRSGLSVMMHREHVDLDSGVFSNNGEHGISVGVDSDNRVSGSSLNAMGTIECSNNTLSGVAIGWGSQAAFTALTGTGNGEYGLSFTEDALNASVQVTSATAITGTSGDFTVDGGGTTLTWLTELAADLDKVRNLATGAVIERKD